MRGLQNAPIGAPAMVVRVYPYTSCKDLVSIIVYRGISNGMGVRIRTTDTHLSLSWHDFVQFMSGINVPVMVNIY